MIKVRDGNQKPVKNSEQFLSEMADKPFGVDDRIERVTISLEGSLFDKIDDIVRHRKRAKENNRTMSAYIREAVLAYMSK